MTIDVQYSLLTDVFNLHDVFFQSVLHLIKVVLLSMVATRRIKCKLLLLQGTLINGGNSLGFQCSLRHTTS